MKKRYRFVVKQDSSVSVVMNNLIVNKGNGSCKILSSEKDSAEL